MIEERFKVGKWKLIDILFADGICENCKKPITYLYFIEDEKGSDIFPVLKNGASCFHELLLHTLHRR